MLKARTFKSSVAAGFLLALGSAANIIVHVVFGLVVEVTSYDVAWLVSGAIALAALTAMLVGRRLLLRGRAVHDESGKRSRGG